MVSGQIMQQPGFKPSLLDRIVPILFAIVYYPTGFFVLGLFASFNFTRIVGVLYDVTPLIALGFLLATKKTSRAKIKTRRQYWKDRLLFWLLIVGVIVQGIVLSLTFIPLSVFASAQQISWSTLFAPEVIPQEGRSVQSMDNMAGVTWYDRYAPGKADQLVAEKYSFLQKAGISAYGGLFYARTSSKSGLHMMCSHDIGDHGGIVVFNDSGSFFKILSAPQKFLQTSVSCNWLGDGSIFFYYFIKSGADRGNYYYYVNPTLENPVFQPIELNANLSRKKFIGPDSGYSFLSNEVMPSNDSGLFATSYCLETRGFIEQSCVRRAVAVSRGGDFKEVMVKNTKDKFTLGWQGNILYIFEEEWGGDGSGTVYVFDGNSFELKSPGT